MYLHLPSIWIAFIAFFITLICSIGYLFQKKESFDIVAVSSTEIGLIFLAICLFTGAIWGKPTWGVYWTWDARLTTTLILFLIFVGYLLLRKFTEYGERQAKFSAILAIFGCADIPLIHQSVIWWNTLHQPSTFFSPKKKNVIYDQFAEMLWLNLLAFSFLFLFFLLKRIQQEKRNRTFYKKVAQSYS